MGAIIIMDDRMSFKTFLVLTDLLISKEYRNRPRVVCGDGFSISIQRSFYHYCDLQTKLDNFDEITYPDDIRDTEYELGYPSEEDYKIIEYAEDPDHLLDTVYGFVPYAVVEDLLYRHGGIANLDFCC